MTNTLYRALLSLLLSAVAASAQTLAMADVTVIDVMMGVAVPDQTVVVSGEWITAVGAVSSVEIPAGAVVVEGRGRYLIPGLWDMHVHTGSDANTRGIIYPLLVAHGVTGVRNMMGDCFDCGPVGFAIDQVDGRRRAVAAGNLLGPRVVASSAFAGSHEQAARRPSEGSSPQAPATEADARAFVRLAKERGADFIKVYDMLPRDAYFAMANEAKRLRLPFAGHVPVEVRTSEASDAGQASVEHLGRGNVLEECSSREDELRARIIAALHAAEMGSRRTPDGPALLPLMVDMVASYDPARCARLASRLAGNGTWFVPTLMTSRLPDELGTGWRESPYARFLPPDERAFFEEAEEAYASDLGDPEEQAPISRWVREVTGDMHRAGVPMLAGSDAGVPGIFWGISLHQELELLVSAGFTPAEALRTATLGPAEFLEATDSLGTVETGKLADLVLLDGNPLEDISNTQGIAAVVLRGRYLDRHALDTLLGDAESVARHARAGAPLSPAHGSAGPDTSAVLDAAETFLTAFNNLEWGAFHVSFAPSATVFQPFGEPWRNDDREEIAAFFGPLFDEIRSSTDGPPYMNITPRDLRIEMLDDAGIVTFHLPGREAVGRRTLVFGRAGPTDPWRIFHLHASSLQRSGTARQAGAPVRDLEHEAAARYAGLYVLNDPDGPGMSVIFRVGDDGLESELAGSIRALRYLGGHAFQEVESGFLFVFNVLEGGRAVGITGFSPELDTVEVFERLDERDRP